MSAPTDVPTKRAAVGGGHSEDGAASRPSQTNRQGIVDPTETPESDTVPSDLCGKTGLRPLTTNGESLRPEAVMIETPEGYTVPADGPGDPEGEAKARPWYRVLSEWRDWYKGYESSHITFERGDGKVARTRLKNAYQPEYGNKYYAKLKDLERGIERSYESLTTVMLTLSASTVNANGNPRAPADHMREIADGWDTARKQLYHALDDVEWEYARVWEPTSEEGKGPAGYGHLHVAVFVEADETEIGRGDFEGVLRSYVDAVDAAAWDAHRPGGNAVSVSHGLNGGEEDESDDEEALNNLASYITEYIGTFGERALERPTHEQQFYAVTWATGTQRVTFSNGANEIVRGEQFRRETGLRPEDRGGEEEGATEEYDPEKQWEARCICYVHSRTPERTDPTTGGTEFIETKTRKGVDPPPSIR